MRGFLRMSDHHMEKNYTTYTEEETLSLGRQIGSILGPGDIVLLYGEPGCGKTVLVRGICAARGYKGYVTSPTFALANEYPSQPPVYHLDLYRLDPQQALEIGIEEYAERLGIVCIEWPEGVSDLFPGALEVHITKGTAECERRFEIIWGENRG